MVAPYSPIGRSELVHLGAATKIEAVVRILASLGYRIRFINSAHNLRRAAATSARRSTIGGIRVVEITPFTLPSRPLGKLLNLSVAWLLGKRFAKDNLRAINWVYNGYAFESLFALRFRSPHLVVEIEDLPFSRRRGSLEIKDRLDRLLLAKIIHRAKLITVVNEDIRAGLPPVSCPTMLLPSLLRNAVSALPAKAPFSTRPYRVGYFGGLTVEKGADLMLSLAACLPDGWDMAVTGSGELAGQFRAAAQQSRRIIFLENAPERELLLLMASTDVLVNPHKSIAHMGGIFPFKVYEFLSTGRLVVSTPLPTAGTELGNSIVWFDGGLEELRRLLLEAAETYFQRRPSIAETAATVTALYSEQSVGERIREILDPRQAPAACRGAAASMARFAGGADDIA